MELNIEKLINDLSQRNKELILLLETTIEGWKESNKIIDRYGELSERMERYIRANNKL